MSACGRSANLEYMSIRGYLTTQAICALSVLTLFGQVSTSRLTGSIQDSSGGTVAGAKVTVNFEHAGKQVIDSAVVRLVYVGDDPRA